MFLNEESDLGSSESQPPSTGDWVRHAFQYHIDDITKEVSSPPAG
jgi:hypothetical protein